MKGTLIIMTRMHLLSSFAYTTNYVNISVIYISPKSSNPSANVSIAVHGLQCVCL